MTKSLISMTLAFQLGLAPVLHADPPHVLPGAAPRAGRVQSPRDLILRIQERSPDVLDFNELESFAERSTQSVNYLGAGAGRDNQAILVAAAAVYLELYRESRLEYLLQNFVRQLLMEAQISGGVVQNSEALLFDFKRLLPVGLFDRYPALRKRRVGLARDLETQFLNAAQIEEVQASYRGAIEAAYLTLRIAEAKMEYAGARYARTDSRYLQEVHQADAVKDSVYEGFAILNTRAFKRDLEPIYKREFAASAQMTEAAVNEFNLNFNHYIEQERSVDDLVDFLSGSEMRDLGTSLSNAFQDPGRERFRERIEVTFDDALKETGSNLRSEINRQIQEVSFEDIFAGVDAVLNRPKESSHEFKQWLVRAFREQPLHWLLTENYPFLRPGADALTGVVQTELRREGSERTTRQIALAVILGAAPIFGNPGVGIATQWGKVPLTFVRAASIGAASYISYKMAVDTYRSYLDWREIQRLNRLSLEGAGLATLAQESIAFKSMVAQGTLTGAAMVFTGCTAGVFSIRNPPSGTIGDYQKALKGNISDLVKTLKSHSLKGVPVIGRQVAGNLGALFTRLAIDFPFMVSKLAPKFASKLGKTVFEGSIFGVATGVVGVTVGHYINAAAIEVFVSAFEQVGKVPPTYWKINSLNQEWKSQRDAFNTIYSNLTFALSEISSHKALYELLAARFKDSTISDAERASVRDSMTGAQNSMNARLKLELIRWYELVEYRDIIDSVMPELGFKLEATPNRIEPTALTLVLRIGDSTVAVTESTAAIEDLKYRTSEFGGELDQKELQKLIEKLGD